MPRRVRIEVDGHMPRDAADDLQMTVDVRGARSVLEGEILDEKQRLVARASGTFKFWRNP